jgi:hypothetical protein
VLWEEVGRGTTGYALHGFLAALDIARARQDPAQAEHFSEILEEILRGFGHETPFGRMRPYVRPDLDALEHSVIRTFHTFPTSRWHLVERALAVCADREHLLPQEVLHSIAEVATARKARILDGQARRGLSLSLRDPSELERAVEMFSQAGAVPYVARARCELAILSDDEPALIAGLRALEVLGDLEQLMRFRRLRRP